MLSFVKSNSNKELEGEVYIYGDNEGLADLIGYLSYLLRQSEDPSFDLSEGNELSKIEEKNLKRGYSNVVYVKLVNIETKERND